MWRRYTFESMTSSVPIDEAGAGAVEAGVFGLGDEDLRSHGLEAAPGFRLDFDPVGGGRLPGLGELRRGGRKSGEGEVKL